MDEQSTRITRLNRLAGLEQDAFFRALFAGRFEMLATLRRRQDATSRAISQAWVA